PDAADPWRGVLSGRSDGDRLGPRSEGTAIGDGVPGPDARARARDVIAPVDSLDRGRVAPMERAIAAVGLHHGRGKPSDPVLPPGSQADATSTTPRSAAEVGMGDRLLSCVCIHLQTVGGIVFRRQARSRLGAEDVPLAEKEAAGDLPRLTFGSSDPAAADSGG